MRAHRAKSGIETASRLYLRDQLVEAVASLLERPTRTVLSMVLVAVSAALIVIVTALGTSAAQQVSARFDALRATVVEVGVEGIGDSGATGAEAAGRLIEQFPIDVYDRLTLLDNVVSAGALLQLDTQAEVSLSPSVLAISQPGPGSGEDVYLSDAGLGEAAEVSVRGRWIHAGDQHARRKVVIVGRLVAERLGLTSPRGMLLIDGVPYAIIGVVEESPLRPQLLDGVIVPRSLDQVARGWNVTDSSVVIVRTLPGAAQDIADQAALQLYPEQPGMFSSSAPPDPERFRTTLESDTKQIVQAFAAAGIFLGMLATCFVWMSTITLRRGTIGVLVAVGATRVHVFRLILTECVLGGLIAGVIGASTGVVAVAAICLARDWQLVMAPYLPLVTIIGTAGAGGLAGAIPAWSAARVDPVESLRSG